jgi:hypothetical protein
LHYFITAESTWDVPLSELQPLFELGRVLNRVAADLAIEGIEFVGAVVVVMNPAICPPFPPGMVIRRARKEWDIKPSIDFADWTKADARGRLDLFIQATLSQLACQSEKRVPRAAIQDLEQAFSRALLAMAN